jgi:hypothetical protein
MRTERGRKFADKLAKLEELLAMACEARGVVESAALARRLFVAVNDEPLRLTSF